MILGLSKSRGHRSGWRGRLPAAVLVTLLVFALAAVSSVVELADSDPPAVPPVVVTLSTASLPVAIPGSFLGVSTEYVALPVYGHHLRLFERVLSLLHVPGSGAMFLRIGGDSADHAFWNPRLRRLPRWVFRLSPRWTELASDIVRRLGVRLIIDLNLITGSPTIAADWARAAEARLPRGSILGFEVGNEPDLYSRRTWLRVTDGNLIEGRSLPISMTPTGYMADFRAYSEVLSRDSEPDLIGPAVAYPQSHPRWLQAMLTDPPPSLSMVSVHGYPYSACAGRHSPIFPTIRRLLSDHASSGVAAGLAPLIAEAHRAGLPFRLTELNSVTCGGRPDVSNSFATALWAPDTLFALLHAGADGVGMHIRANTVNAPFALSDRGLFARPLLYGLLLFGRALSGGSQLLPLNVSAPPGLGIKVWAVRTGDGELHLLMLDKGGRDARVVLRIPGRGPAVVQRLLAPSPRARVGVTLAGQRLGPHGAWVGRFAAPRLPLTRRGYVLKLPRWSAALVSVRGVNETPGSVLGAGLEPISTLTSRPQNAQLYAPHAPTAGVLGNFPVLPRSGRPAAGRGD